jgi:hypothetical protein
VTGARTLAAAVLALAAFPAVVPPVAADVLDLEDGFPTSVEDAYPIGYLGREIQMHVSYERTHAGDDGVRFRPRVEFGFPRNAQVSVAQRFTTGSVEPNGVGPTELELLYNLNQETLALPAVSLVARADFPTGKPAHGVDAGGKLIVSKTLPGTWHLHRVHANALYQANDDVQPGERGARFRFVVGYSTVVTNELLFVGDLLREHTFSEDEEVNLAEVGLRYALTPRMVVSAGVGFGIGDESPDVRAAMGVQYEF